MSVYEFRAAVMGDVGLLSGWLRRAHVRAWWDSDVPYTLDGLRDPRVARWIVGMGGVPFAYIQDYTVQGWAVHGGGAHHFAHLPAGARGIDQYIGAPDMVGRGHGTGFIAAHMRGLFAAGAPVIATDPHPDNARAIAVYRKLGFVVTGPQQETKWGLILPMLAETAP